MLRLVIQYKLSVVLFVAPGALPAAPATHPAVYTPRFELNKSEGGQKPSF